MKLIETPREWAGDDVRRFLDPARVALATGYETQRTRLLVDGMFVIVDAPLDVVIGWLERYTPQGPVRHIQGYGGCWCGLRHD